MDEKPKCSQEVEPITQQPSKKKHDTESNDQKDLLLLSKEHSPTPKSVLTKHQLPFHEDRPETAKTVPLIDQPINLTDEPINLSDEPINSTDDPINSTDPLISSTNQPIHLIDQPILSTQQSNFLPEQSICLPGQKNNSTEKIASLTDRAIILTNYLADESINSKDRPVFPKTHPAHSDDQSPNLKTQTLLIKEDPILLIDQPIHLKGQPDFYRDRVVSLEDQSAIPKTQVVATKDTSTFPTDQPNKTPENPIFSKEQPCYSKDQFTNSTQQPVFSPKQSMFTQDQPTSSKYQPAVDSRKQKSCSSNEQRGLSKNQIDPTLHATSSSRELLIAPKMIAAASTKYVSVFPKNEVTKLMGNSINVEYGISLCAATANAANSMNNGYFISTNESNDPLKLNISTQSPHPITLLPVPASVAVAVGTQPASLFLQALSKLNETSLTLAVINHFRLQSRSNLSRSFTFLSGDITPPDSLTSAPPTYSFVLRQIAGRRRPRFMGSFFPSPSFVQQTPPPTYTGAFDVYVEPALPPPPTRNYSLGYNSMPVVCPECGFTGMTIIRAHVTVCTHCCAFILCILCCWICAPLPYFLTSCKDVYHYCRNCRSFLGMYCPSNPDTTSIYPSNLNR